MTACHEVKIALQPTKYHSYTPRTLTIGDNYFGRREFSAKEEEKKKKERASGIDLKGSRRTFGCKLATPAMGVAARSGPRQILQEMWRNGFSIRR